MSWSGLLIRGTGEIAGSATALVCPTLKCMMINFKAQSNNEGKAYIGITPGVTVAAGTEDTTTGWGLAAGEETGYIPCGNLNEFYRICDNAGDDLMYIALG